MDALIVIFITGLIGLFTGLLKKPTLNLIITLCGLAVAFAVVLAVGLGVAFVVAACVGTIANASINVITTPKMRLIAIPLKFAN